VRTRNAVSEAVQRHLDHKYRLQLERFGRLKGSEEVCREWKACLARGEVAAAMWAACTHRAAGEDVHKLVYGDIHMLSHQIGAGQAADSRRLAHLENENGALRQRLRSVETRLQQRIDRLEQDKVGLARQLSAAREAEAERAALRRRLAELEAVGGGGRGWPEVQQANERVAAVEARAAQLERRLKAAEDAAAEHARERDALAFEHQALQRLLAAIKPPEAGCMAGAGPDCDGCARAAAASCVLCVGGRASTLGPCRQLAERLGIRLLHHDGGQEESLARLPELIRCADAVVCPTDSVSHSAYYQVKNHCKRVGKPCLFYKGAGVSGFALAMSRVLRGEFSVAGQGAAGG
jgi:hypothetical protein